MVRPAFRLPTAVIVCLLAAAPAPAQVPPDEAWRTVDTEHFRITFPEHLEELGRRAGDLAERAYRELTAQFREGPTGPIDIVLTDHADVSNGFATMWPSNRIVLYARPPADHLALAYFDDWLELLITHELAHVFHLDYGGTLGTVFRALFGRAPTPFNFPGVVVPGWVIEGLATWYESALTGAGRVHGTFHEMVLRTAMLEGRFESIGQAGGQLAAVAGRDPPLRVRLALLRLPARQARARRHDRLRRGRGAPGGATAAAAVELGRPARLRRVAVERMDRLDGRDAGGAEPPR